MASPPSAADSLLEMEAVGYPMGTKAMLRTPVDINPGLLELKDIIETHIIDYLELRASPAPDVEVYSVQGDMQPGHSGAPIIDREGRVLAIGNGGLKSGTIGHGWAIPVAKLVWEIVHTSVGPDVSKGAQRDISRFVSS